MSGLFLHLTHSLRSKECSTWNKKENTFCMKSKM